MTNQTVKTPARSLNIEAREWYDRQNGNSYFSARIWVDGEIVHTLPFQYGYGDYFQQRATEWLTENDYLDGREPHEHMSTFAARLGFDFYTSKTDALKREMFK